MKNVLDVGQCRPDHGAIRHLVEGHFDARVTQAHDADDALAKLRAGRFDLVLINRKLDADYTDGLEIIQQMKADPELATIPVMLVSNYPEYQQAAVAAGAEPGFGKAQTDEPETRKRLEKFLG
jgi:CheY-like chemotaxis protein